MHGAERGDVDGVLALVVGSAAAIDALAHRGAAPRIEAIAPLAFHAGHDVAMAIHQHGRQIIALVIGREQVRPAA